MLSITKLILKHDLQYELTNEEQRFFDTMEQDEIISIRKNIIKNIRGGMLPIDFLEDVLEELKNSEYKKYLSGRGLGKDVKEQTVYLERIEGNCNRMIINLAKDASKPTDDCGLLGPDIHDTYGIKK